MHRERWKSFAEQAGARAQVVYLMVSEEEIYKRSAQALLDGSHHALDAKFVQSSIARLEAPTDCIMITTEESKQRFLKSLAG